MEVPTLVNGSEGMICDKAELFDWYNTNNDRGYNRGNGYYLKMPHFCNPKKRTFLFSYKPPSKYIVAMCEEYHRYKPDEYPEDNEVKAAHFTSLVSVEKEKRKRKKKRKRTVEEGKP